LKTILKSETLIETPSVALSEGEGAIVTGRLHHH
jgi:hypothetical protein